MSSGSGYAGRHRDPVPTAGAPASGQGHQLVWLLGGAIAVVMLLFGVLVYPNVGGNGPSSPTGGRPVASVTSDSGLQLLRQQESSGTGSEWPTGTSTATTAGSTSDPTADRSATVTPDVTAATSTADGVSGQGTTASDPTSPEVASRSTRGTTTSTTGSSTTSSASATGSASGTTTPRPAPSPSPTSDNPRAVAQALFPEFGFPDNEFGCLNAAWNRLGLWTTSAAVRPGLIYLKGRYGTPCAAWDHVRKTGNY